VSNVEKRILDQLRNSVRDFMNDRKWTPDIYAFDEKIKCNILITVDEVVGNSQYSGSMQIQSNRIVYNSNYESPMLNFIDQDISFDYLENTIIEFNLGQFQNNLSSILAYYAYLIIGLDYDSFSPSGGSAYYSKAQQIVVDAQNSGSPGWKAFENQKNRYWIVENILHQQFKTLRQTMYEFHRLGLDAMYDNANTGRAKITQSIDKLKKVHQARPLSYNMRLFFLAKADEIINIYSEAPQQEKTAVYNTLQLIDPSNLSKYSALKGGG
jgi:hypothetical protein